jgi:hypothetical protein
MDAGEADAGGDFSSAGKLEKEGEHMIPSHRDRGDSANEDASLLLVAGATPHCDWQRLLPLFEQAGCTLPVSTQLEEWLASARGSAELGQSGVAMLHHGAHHQSLLAATKTLLGACLSPVLLPVEDMEQRPEFWLEQLPGARLLMFHSRPESALVMAMGEDSPLEDVLAQWTSAAEVLVQTFRCHRRRVTLIDVECALAAPSEFLRNCKTSFGTNPLPDSAASTAGERAGSDMHRLIAAQMIAQNRKALDLIAELEACSLPIGEPAVPPFIDCVALHARQREEQAQRDRAEEDRDRYRLLADERGERLVAAEQARDEATAKLRVAAAGLAEEKSARELMAVQLRQASEALDAATLGQLSTPTEN